MLDLLRKNTRSFVVYLLFAIIIVVFVFTFNTITPEQACGTQGPGALTADLVEVGGETIDTNILNMATTLTVNPPAPGSQELEAMQRSFAYRMTRFTNLGLPTAFGDFGPDPHQVSPIRIEKAMSDLVESVLVADEARELGLVVSNAELTERLVSDASWYDPESGAFRRDAYESFVRYQLGTTIPRFEAFVRRELLRDKLIAVLTSGVDISRQEVAFHHAARNEEVSLEAVIVDRDAAAGLVEVDRDALVDWLAEHQDDVAAYYEDNLDDYRKEARAIVRGIQVKAPNRALVRMEDSEEKKAEMDGEREEARKKAGEIRAELQAKAVTEEAPPAEDGPGGGDETAEGETAEAEDVEAPTPVEDVVPVEAFEAAVEEHSDHGGSRSEGGLFAEPRDREAMGRWPFGEEVPGAVFDLKPGQITDVVEVDSGFWILRLEEHLPPEERSLDQVRMEIAETLYRQDKAEAFMGELADAVLAAAKESPEAPLSEVVASVNAAYGVIDEGRALSVTETGSFARLEGGGGPMAGRARFGNVPRVGRSEALARAAFAAPEDEPLLGQVFEVADGRKLVIARVSDRREAGEMEASAEEALRARLLRDKKKSFYRGWYDDLLSRALEEDRVVFTKAWAQRRDEAVETYRQSGGAVPAPAGSAGAAAPADAPIEIEVPSPEQEPAPAE